MPLKRNVLEWYLGTTDWWCTHPHGSRPLERCERWTSLICREHMLAQKWHVYWRPVDRVFDLCDQIMGNESCMHNYFPQPYLHILFSSEVILWSSDGSYIRHCIRSILHMPQSTIYLLHHTTHHHLLSALYHTTPSIFCIIPQSIYHTTQLCLPSTSYHPATFIFCIIPHNTIYLLHHTTQKHLPSASYYTAPSALYITPHSYIYFLHHTTQHHLPSTCTSYHTIYLINHIT